MPRHYWRVAATSSGSTNVTSTMTTCENNDLEEQPLQIGDIVEYLGGHVGPPEGSIGEIMNRNSLGSWGVYFQDWNEGHGLDGHSPTGFGGEYLGQGRLQRINFSIPQSKPTKVKKKGICAFWDKHEV